MSDIPIKNIGPIDPGSIDSSKSANQEEGGNFESVINEAISKVSQVQDDVEKAVDELANGGDVTNAILAIEKADMSFQLMVEVRNKLLTTYEEIMKLQM
jgi:flagellar hook-basal body complex protein FliE